MNNLQVNNARLILLSMVFLCYAACTIKAQYRFDQLTVDDGLPQNSVRAITQTTDGYIWFTTLDGLVRFDGVRLTVFNKSNSKNNLPSNRLNSLYSEGNTLWVNTEDRNLVRYQNGEFRLFTPNDGLPNQSFEVMKDIDGRLMAFTSKGIARFDGSRFFVAPGFDSEHVEKFRFYVAPSGTRWEVNIEGLSATRNGNITKYDIPSNLRELLASRVDIFGLTNMIEESEGKLWLSIGRYLFKLQDGVVEQIKAEEMPPNEITSLILNRHKELWFGTQGKGLCRLSQNRVNCFDSTQGLHSNFVRELFIDRESTMWIATNEKGIYRLTEQAIKPLSVSEGLAEKNAYSILEDKQGTIWIGSFGALARYKDGVVTNYRGRDGLLYSNVQSLFEDSDGRLWIGSLEGVEYFRDGKFYDFMPELNAKSFGFGVFDIHRDRQGVLWFATSKGLIKYDNRTVTWLTTADGLPGDSVKAILETRNGGLWIGTHSGIAELKNGKFTALTEADGLAGNHVRSLYEDKSGTLWIGTYESGLSRLKNGKFTSYNTGNGLSGNGVFQIIEDASGNFWMSSNQGIYRVSRSHLEEFAEGRRATVTSTSFGKSDGMLNRECNGGGQPAGTSARDGRLFFPTQDGVAIINPEKVSFNPLPPPVVIENARIDNQLFKISENEIKLQPGQENLEIDYTGLSFIKSEQMRFRYRLEGLDEDWTEAGTRRTAFYPHIAPGNYTFHVIAANSDNVWNEQGATIKVTVLPPFYRTWWFIALCVLGVVGLAFMIYRTRINHLKKERAAKEEFSRRLIIAHESERRRVAAELHDSLGQTLAMIKNRAVFAVQNTNNLEGAKEQFEQITEQSVYAINEVREISHNLRPYLLDRLGLTKALKSLFNKTVEHSRLKIKAEIENIDNLFTSEEEMSLYRIVQESLNNILKHAEASEVNITIKKSDNNLSVKIQDNGKGFSTDGVFNNDKKGGFGLLGMAERIKILGGTHIIESALGKGTNIIIKFDISKRTKTQSNGKAN